MRELSLPSVSPSEVLEFSKSRGEHEWMQRLRQRALELYSVLPVEQSGLYGKKYFDLSAIDFSGVDLFPSREAIELSMESKALKEKNLKEAGFWQTDVNNTDSSISDELKGAGVIFAELSTALKNYPDLVKQYFGVAIEPEEDKFAALTTALLNSGTLLYVPKGVDVGVPFRSISLMAKPGVAVFSRGIIIAEEGSRLTLLEEGYSQKDGQSNTPSIHSSILEVYVGPSAEVNFGAIQNFHDNVVVFSNRRSLGQRDSKMNWTVGFFGGLMTRSRLDSVMQDSGACAEDLEVVLADGSQRFDLLSNLTHTAQHTRGSVIAKGVIKDKGRSIFKGMIRIDKNAKHSDSYLAEHAMLLSKDARSETIPGLEIETNEVRATHSSSVAQVDWEQVFYLMARGLPQHLAKEMLITAFLDPVVQRMPNREVKWKVRNIISRKWEGVKGSIAVEDKTEEELLEEAEVAMQEKVDVFQTHYKYRTQRI